MIPAKVYALTTYGFVTYANLIDASKALEDKNAHCRLFGEGVSVIIDAVYCYHCIVLIKCDLFIGYCGAGWSTGTSSGS